MNTLLFPYSFKALGWICLIPGMIAGLCLLCFPALTSDFSSVVQTVINDIVIIAVCLGAIMVACSREKVEDEMTVCIRLNSLLCALYVYMGVIFIGTLLLNDFAYLYFMIVNLCFFPVLFMVVFRVRLWRAKANLCHEE